MKKILILSVLCVGAAFASGCAGETDGYYDPGTDDGSSYYAVNSIYSEGMDDSGNMWMGITGSFDSSGNDVEGQCDGQPVGVTVESESPTLIEISTVAADQYSSCTFSVYDQGQIVGAISESNVDPMEITNATVSAAPAPDYVEVSLTGDFFIRPLHHSSLSVVANCNGLPTFSPQITDVSSAGIVVMVPNPGSGFGESCNFQVQDTYPNDAGNSEVTVTSPNYQVAVTGV